MGVGHRVVQGVNPSPHASRVLPAAEKIWRARGVVKLARTGYEPTSCERGDACLVGVE